MKRIAVGLILFAVAGCATVPGGGYPANSSQQSPLRAHLLPATSGSWGYAFDLSDEAYVAVFRISPRSGATLVYPRGGQGSVDRPTHRGLTHIPGRLTRFAGSRISSVIPSHAAQPDFYMLVASETPLDLTAVGPFGDGLRFALGAGGARFQSPYSSMERLASLVVPDPTQNNWTTDYYVDWPDVLHSSPGLGLVRLACGDVQAYVPREMLQEAIATLCANQIPDTTEPVAPADSAPSATPVRRDPPKLDDRISSRQLEAPRDWESSMRRANRLLGDRGIAASGDVQGIDRSNALRRSGNGPGVNRRLGDVNDSPSASGRSIDRGNQGGTASGRAEPSAGSSRGSSGGDAGGRPSSNSNPAVKGTS